MNTKPIIAAILVLVAMAVPGCPMGRAADDTDYLQKLWDQAADGSTLTIPARSYKFSRPLKFLGKTVYLNSEGAILCAVGDFAEPYITLGGKPGQNVAGGRWTGPYIYKDKPTWMTSDKSETGLRIQNCNHWRIEGLQVWRCSDAVEVRGDGTGCSYNHIGVAKLQEARTFLKATRANGGWANQNVVEGGSWHASNKIWEANPAAIVTFVSLDSGGLPYAFNGWTFREHSFEGWGGSRMLWANVSGGSCYNIFRDGRYESGTGEDVRFSIGPGSYAVGMVEGVQYHVSWDDHSGRVDPRTGHKDNYRILMGVKVN